MPCAFSRNAAEELPTFDTCRQQIAHCCVTGRLAGEFNRVAVRHDCLALAFGETVIQARVQLAKHYSPLGYVLIDVVHHGDTKGRREARHLAIEAAQRERELSKTISISGA